LAENKSIHQYFCRVYYSFKYSRLWALQMDLLTPGSPASQFLWHILRANFWTFSSFL